MKLIDLLYQVIMIARDDPSFLDAHVEVHGHDGSWSWVDRVSPLKLNDSDSGITRTVVIGVSTDNIRQPTQPIGKPASSAPIEHKKDNT